jgi:hypothetical protein
MRLNSTGRGFEQLESTKSHSIGDDCSKEL